MVTCPECGATNNFQVTTHISSTYPDLEYGDEIIPFDWNSHDIWSVKTKIDVECLSCGKQIPNTLLQDQFGNEYIALGEYDEEEEAIG